MYIDELLPMVDSYALKCLKKSKNMMNEIFAFLDGNTIVCKCRRLNKACFELLTVLGSIQAERVVAIRMAPSSSNQTME